MSVHSKDPTKMPRQVTAVWRLWWDLGALRRAR